MGLSCTLHTLSSEGAARLAAGDESASPELIASLKLEKTWGAVHYLVGGAPETDEDNPRIEDFMLSGIFLDVSEHVAVHTGGEVQKFAALMKATSVEELSVRFNPETMNSEEVYGEPWDLSGKQYVMQLLSDFLQFIAAAAQEKHGMMVIIC
jgi:hypothetical protein